MTDPIFLSITFYGMAVVISFLVAVLIKGIALVLPLLHRRDMTEVRQASKPDVAVLPPEHVAAIAAAVASVVTTRHIIHIEDRGRANVWSAEGRMLHQTSHAVAHTPKR